VLWNAGRNAVGNEVTQVVNNNMEAVAKGVSDVPSRQIYHGFSGTMGGVDIGM
jgi:hypothetical protein